MTDIQPLAVDAWNVENVIPYARNARKISDAAVAKVAASIQEFGWRQPIVVDANGVIIAGHTRLLAARQLGMSRVPVHVAHGLSDAQVKALRIMDNRSHQESKWDYEMLATEFAELKDTDLSLTGFEAFEIEPLLGAEWSPRDSADDPAGGGSVKFTPDQYAVVCEAVTKLRDQRADTTLKEAAALTAICELYIA